MPNLPIVSVLIPTFNGADRLSDLLRSLQAQTFADFEIVVMVDGSTDATAAVLRHWQTREPRLRWYEQENQGRAATRNAARARALSELLIFFDDDVTAERDAVAAHLDFHRTHSNSLLTGSVREYLWPDSTELERFKAQRTEMWNSKASRQPPGLFENVSAANLSLPAEVFDRLGGFNARLGDAEDFELGLRARRQGIASHWSEGPTVWHTGRFTFRSYIQRRRQYRKARLHVFKEHFPGQPLPEIEQLTPFKWAVYWLVSRPSVARLADAGAFRFLPVTLRDRLYDLVVHGLAHVFPERPVD